MKKLFLVQNKTYYDLKVLRNRNTQIAIVFIKFEEEPITERFN